MQGFYTILLLVASNIFMTCAWYGHLKMKQQFSWFEHLPLIGVVLFSWFLAFFEYNKIEKTKWESLCDSVINLVFSLGRDHCSDVCISGRKNLSGTSICIYLSAEHLCSSF